MNPDPDPIVMYLIVRRSLKLPSGKVGAQCGHAVQYLMEDVLPERWPSREKGDLLGRHLAGTITSEGQARLDVLEREDTERVARHDVAREWLKKGGDHTKIVLGATDDEFMRVQLENAHFFMVVDRGYTEVAPNTETSLGLWPCRKSEASETVKTLKPLRDADAREGTKVSWRELFKAVHKANDALFDVIPLDPEHQVECHADTLPKVFLKLAHGAQRALEHLQGPIRKQVDG